MTIARRIGWNLLAGASGKVIFTVLGLATFAVVTRSLGPEDFGLYRTIFTYISLVGVLAHFGTPALALREISRPEADQARVIGNAIALRLVLMLAVLLIGVVAVPVFGLDPRVQLGALVAVLGWTALEVGNVIIVVFQNRLKQHLASLAEVLGGVVTLALVLAIAYMGLGLYWMVAAFAAGRLFIAAMAWKLADRLVSLSLRFDRASWQYLLEHGWPLGLSVIVTVIIARGDIMAMALFHPAAAVGLYGVASKMLEMIVTIPNLLAPLMMPQFVGAGRDMKRLGAYMNAGLRALLVIGVFTLFALINFSTDVVKLVAGSDYEQAGIILKIMSPAVVVLFVSILVRFLLITLGKQRLMLMADLIGLAVVLPAYGFLVPAWSYVGAAIAMTLAHLATLIAALYFSVRQLEVHLELGFLTKLIPIGLFAQAVFFLLNRFDFQWMLNLTAGAVIYLLLAFMTGLVPRALLQRSSGSVS